MNDCRDQLDGRLDDGRAARWAGVDLLGCDEDAVVTERSDERRSPLHRWVLQRMETT